MPKPRRSTRAKNIAGAIAAFALIAIIIWIDLATGLWNDLVIIAGLAAGLVSFLLSVLVFNRLVARATERKWAPVNRFALTEFLHSIADEKHSEISRGHIVPRSLSIVQPSDDRETLHADLHQLRHEVVNERRRLSDALSRWAEFLAASGSNEDVLRHIADIALQLDCVRDASIEVEHSPAEATGRALDAVITETQRCNELMVSLETELRRQIEHEDQLDR